MQALSAPNPPTLPDARTQANHARLKGQWQSLDQADEWAQFGRPQDASPGEWESHVSFEGMYCAACAVTIEHALTRVPGVRAVQVSPATHQGRIVWSADHCKPSDWFEAAARAGYPAVPAGNGQALRARRAASRKLLWQWVVAGFCMMQVMMYSTPLYWLEPGDMSPDLMTLMRWAQWLLSVPVLLFSCGPFFQGALRDLRQRQIGMDTPVALGMLVTFVASTIATLDPQGMLGDEVYFDSLTMFVFFLLSGRWLEQRMRDRTAGALEALMHRMPDQVLRWTVQGRAPQDLQMDADQVQSVSPRQLKKGQYVLIQPGQAFVADGRIHWGQTQVDEALLTGESRPLARGQGDAVIAGSHNLQAPVWVHIERLGTETRFSEIVQLMEVASVSKPRMAQWADAIAKPFLWAVLLAAGLSALYWWDAGPAHALMIAVAVLIVTCPCALSLATPAALLTAAGRLARQGVLLRHLQALDTLPAVDVVIFDKTGTLTQDSLGLHQTRVHNSAWSAAAALAQAAQLAAHSLHPASRALVKAQQDAAATANSGPQAVLQDESPKRNWQYQEFAGQGVQAQDAEGRAVLRLGSAAFCADIGGSAAAEPMPSAKGAHMQVHLAGPEGFIASFDLEETLREDARQAVQSLQALGMHTVLLSGDVSDAVARVAHAVGMSDWQAGCSPADKLQALRRWQADGKHRVAMVGDGLNDGPILAAADVSFSLGHAVPLAQSKSDFVVADAQLGTVVTAFELARKTHTVVRQNLLWALVYNAACVPLAVLGYMPPWVAGLGMALSSLAVVLNAFRLASFTPRTA
jgi:P-type Cu2+ transporter